MNRALLKARLSQILKQADFAEAETGEEALEKLTASVAGTGGSFDIAILDEIYGDLPLRGLDVTKEVRARGITSRTEQPVVIIGFTGNAGLSEHTSAALAAGQNIVWPKPQPSADQMSQDLSEFAQFWDSHSVARE